MHRPLIGLAVVAFLAGCGGDQPAPPTTAATPPAPTTTTPPAPTSAPTTASTESAPPPAPKPAMIDLQKKTYTGFEAAFAAHDAKAVAAMYSTDATFTTYGAGGGMQAKGRDAIEKFFVGYFTGFPDCKLGFSHHFAGKNVVVSQWVFAGTNTGELMGGKPTKKAVGVNGVSVLWFGDDGSITKEQAYWDDGTLLGQLGLSKEKVRPVAALPASEDWIVAKDDDGEKKNLAAFGAQGDAFGKHDLKAFADTIPDDAMQTDYSSTTDAKGKKAVLALVGGYLKAFPDLKMSMDEGGVWAFGDYVVDAGTASGTQTGPLGPVKPTKKAVAVHMCEVNLVKDGKIAKTETYMNSMEMMDQLGLLPKPKEPKPAK